MKFEDLVLLFVTIEATRMHTVSFDFKRLLGVYPEDHSLYTLRSNIGVSSIAICAIYCQIEKCLSFSYTEVNKSCVAYSRLMVERNNADVSMSTKFYSMVLGNCSHINIKSPSGVYKTETQEGKSLDLYCDTDTADGPWTVIQRRTSGDVDFYHNWTDYKNGFGDLLGNFWIGNDNLHLLTTTPRILRVELEAWDGTRGYAQYSEFQVANEDQNYRLLVQGFSGTVFYDAMDYHSGQAFSTYDRDNDHISDNCAMKLLGGWWYKACYHTNLNGGYFTFTGQENSEAMDWWYFPSYSHLAIPLKKSKMMVR